MRDASTETQAPSETTDRSAQLTRRSMQRRPYCARFLRVVGLALALGFGSGGGDPATDPASLAVFCRIRVLRRGVAPSSPASDATEPARVFRAGRRVAAGDVSTNGVGSSMTSIASSSSASPCHAPGRSTSSSTGSGSGVGGLRACFFAGGGLGLLDLGAGCGLGVGAGAGAGAGLGGASNARRGVDCCGSDMRDDDGAGEPGWTDDMREPRGDPTADPPGLLSACWRNEAGLRKGEAEVESGGRPDEGTRGRCGDALVGRSRALSEGGRLACAR